MSAFLSSQPCHCLARSWQISGSAMRLGISMRSTGEARHRKVRVLTGFLARRYLTLDEGCASRVPNAGLFGKDWV